MAEVLGKGNLFASCNYGPRRNRGGFGSFSRRNSGFYLKKNSFPKVRSQALRSDFNGKRIGLLEKKSAIKRGNFHVPVKAQTQTGLIGRSQKWWLKGLQPNMKEVISTQDLVDSLLNAGDELVIVDFFSPGCGGCKTLHPKLCQLAEMNPEVQFLQVNYDEHKLMCYTLHVHVLPFFRFYRGAQGRLCSFSCTNATIRKFKAALAKHTPDRCSLGPTMGLEEKELLALASKKDLSFKYTSKKVQPEPLPTQEEILVSKQAPLEPVQPAHLPTQEEILVSKQVPFESVQPAPFPTQQDILVSKQVPFESVTPLPLQEKALIGAGR